MVTVLNEKNINPLTQPLFLGEPLGTQRYDILKYPIFEELYNNQEEFRWRSEEVSLIKDKNDYFSLSDEERFVFDSNIKFQTLGDSMLSRSIGALSNFVTNTELEQCMHTWANFEIIHSRSYSWIFRNLFGDPKPFFDSIYDDKEIMKRKDLIRENYDKILGQEADSEELRNRIFKAVVSTNIMEGLVFYVSFACSFYFGYRGKMEGNAKIIKLIQRDEALHFSITQNLLKIFKENPAEGFSDIYRNNEELIYEMYRSAALNECEWSEYLFSKGGLLGLNPELLGGYAKWLANNRLRSLGLKKIFPQKDNPLAGWLDSFMDSSKIQVAPQETEISSYKIGARDSEIDFGAFDDIKL